MASSLKDTVQAAIEIQLRYGFDFDQQRKFVESDQLSNILSAEQYMRRDQVTLMLIQSGVLEKWPA